jgi:hypothetical protein
LYSNGEILLAQDYLFVQQHFYEGIRVGVEPVELIAFLAAVVVRVLIMLNLALQFWAMAIT